MTYSMTAAVPATYDDLGMTSQTNMVYSDQDAEGEEDPDIHHVDQPPQGAVHGPDSEDKGNQGNEENGLTVDAHGGGDPRGDDKENEDPARSKQRRRTGVKNEDQDTAVAEVPMSVGSRRKRKSTARSGSESSSEASDVEVEEWEADDDGEIDRSNRGNCM